MCLFLLNMRRELAVQSKVSVEMESIPEGSKRNIPTSSKRIERKSDNHPRGKENQAVRRSE